MQVEHSKFEVDEPTFVRLDEVIHPKDADQIHDNFMDCQFPWHYNDVTAEESNLGLSYVKDTAQFTHTLIDGISNPGVPISMYSSMAETIIESVKQNTQTPIVAIERAKANMLVPQYGWDRSWCNMPHVDKNDDRMSDCNYVSLIYYVNDSDGDTVFFNKWYGQDGTEDNFPMRITTQVRPRKGSLIMFNSNRYHASCPPVDSKRRLVINIVAKVKQ